MVVALGLSAAACADDGSEPISAPSTSESTVDSTTTTDVGTTTTAATTTEVATTTTEVATTTTGPEPTTTLPVEPAEFPYWSAACTEVAGAAATFELDPALIEFSTLGAAPSLDLVMPQVVTSVGPSGSIAATSSIPGGVLVAVYPPDGWPTADEILYSSSLVAVNDDGSIRWRRCFDDDVETRRFAVAPAALGPDVAWVLSGDEPFRIIGVDLATGADVELPLPAADLAELGERGAGSDRFLVLGPKLGGGLVVDGDRLLVVDTLDGSTTDVPVPPSWIANEGGWLFLVDTDPLDDEVVVADGAPSPGESAALYVDGSWTDDPAVRRELLPLQVTETFGEPFELRLYDGAGDLVWTVPEFHSVGREGFHWAVADDVVVAMRCPEWDADGYCGWVGDEPPTEEMVGFDVTTGAELWTRPGSAAVPVIAGSTAIVTDRDGDTSTSGGYVLVDLLTGERIGPDGDAWPEGSFTQECCGGDVYVNVRRDGGVVVATNQEHVRIWYPPEVTRPTATVDLMG